MQNEFSDNLVLTSDLQELKKLEMFLYSFFSEHKISNDIGKKVYLCISEAVMNGIIHGNKFDINKKIFVFLYYDNKTIKAKIKDQGDGFNMDELRNPTSQENIKCESGRGIFIIRSYADECIFNCNGNEIQINFSVYG